MIISETQVKVPSKKYTLLVHCTKTRRLTAIEWLILTCIAKFRDSEVMSKKTLKMAFEQVLDLQDSNYLIKPSIESLTKLGVIETDGIFDYDKTRFGWMKLTERGNQMLNDGLLPGKPSDFKSTIWYNPLTRQLNSQEIKKGTSDETVPFGTKDLYDDVFPEQIIKEKLQSGEVESGKFIASEYIIDGIEDVMTEDAETLLTLITDLNSAGELTITPEIKEEKMLNEVEKLYLIRALKQYGIKKLVPQSEIEIDTIYGSGTKIKDALRDVCRNGKFLFVDKWVYDAFSKEEGIFSNKYLIVFNSGSLSTKFIDSSFVVYVPFEFSIHGCVLINDKSQSVSLCKAKSTYNDKKVEYPLAVSDKRMAKKTGVVLRWFENEIAKSSKRDISYYGLYSLPILNSNQAVCDDLKGLWEKKSFDSIIADFNRIISVPKGIGLSLFDLTPLYPVIEQKLNSENSEQMIANIQKVVSSGIVQQGSDLHMKLVKKALSILSNKPETYSELKKLQSKLGIDNHEVALKFDDLIDPLYSVAVVKDVLNLIMTDKYRITEELFSADGFFNTYSENIEKIKFLVDGCDIFKRQDETAFKKKVTNCPNVALLQAYITGLKEKNATLADNDNINVYSLFNEIDSAKATIFYNNLALIEKFLLEKGNEITLPTEGNNYAEQNLINESIFIIDTCALINHVDLLQYFNCNEYIRIPLKVVEELGIIKDKRVYKSQRTALFNDDRSFEKARYLAKDIINFYLEKMNGFNDLILRIAHSDTSLLPEELDKSIPDNMILSVALKYKDWDVVLITDDNQFRLTAESVGIKTVSGSDFILSHQKNFCERPYIEDKYKSADEASDEVKLWCNKHGEY